MVTECPKVIAEAIYKVQSSITKLNNDSNNKYANYRYVSIDAYYEGIRPKLTDAGLMIIPNEVESGLSPDGKTQKTIIEFYLLHKDGEIWNFPLRRTVFLPYTGAQTSGSALSYADKFIMRTLFKIPTGEYDPEQDAVAPSDPEHEADRKDDADAIATVKGGQGMTIDFNYSGPPYRVFNKDKSVAASFTDVRTWGLTLKKNLSKLPRDTSIYSANKNEIDRISKDINDDQSISDKAKNSLNSSIDSLREYENEVMDDSKPE
jgi:hypothetical protein